MGVWGPCILSFSCLWQHNHPVPCRRTYTPHTPQPAPTPNPRHPHAHVATVEALCYIFHVGDMLPYDLPMWCNRFQQPRATVGGQKPPHISYLLRPPSNSASPGTNKGHHNPPHTAGNQIKNTKVPLASSECTSALPGDVGDDWAHICARF